MTCEEDDDSPEFDPTANAVVRCPHCGELNTFPGWTEMYAFICRFCGQGVNVEKKPV
jgi:uncharacterized protein (DUF983 family)